MSSCPPHPGAHCPARCPRAALTLLLSPFCPRCLQNYIPPQSLTLSCPVCRQTSILPERGVAALQNNFFITNLMEVLQRDPDSRGPHPGPGLDPVSAVTGQPLSCPNHEGKVGGGGGRVCRRRGALSATAAGDGVLLRVLRDGHVPRVHRG